MSALNVLEAEGLTVLASALENNKAAVETELGSVNTLVVADGTKLVEGIDAKLPAIISAPINAALATYAPAAELLVADVEGSAIDKVVAFLRAEAAKLSPPAA
jgi:hypothetical protein